MAKYRVLLVEDDKALRELYKEVFRRKNFEVIEAEDGQMAVDQALVYRPHVVILDLMLPRQGGLHSLKIMRSLPECRNLPIIILTALPEPKYREEAAGKVQGYFLKTEIEPDELAQKAVELIEPLQQEES